MPEVCSDLAQEVVRQRFPIPPYHIAIHLGQADDPTLRRLLRRYDVTVDNRTFTRRVSGAEVDVKLYRCPSNLIPSDLPANKFLVTAASGGGLPESDLIAPVPGAKMFDVWKGPEEGWELHDTIMKTTNQPTIKKRTVLAVGIPESESGPAQPVSPPAASVGAMEAIECKHHPDHQTQADLSGPRGSERESVGYQDSTLPILTKKNGHVLQSTHRNPDDGRFLPRVSTQKADASTIRGNLAELPQHIAMLLAQAPISTLSELLRIEYRLIDRTKAGNPITYSLPGINTPLTVKACLCPDNVVPSELRKARRSIVLVASGLGLMEPVAIASFDDPRIFWIWRGASGYEHKYQVLKTIGTGPSGKKRRRDNESSDDSDGSIEDVNAVDSNVGEHNLLFGKRPRTSVDYARTPEMEEEEHLSNSLRQAKRTELEKLRNSSAPAAFKQKPKRQAYDPNKPALGRTIQLLTPTPTTVAPFTGIPHLKPTVAQAVFQKNPQAASIDEKRARTTLCFVRASSDLSLKFPLGVVDSIQKFFKLAEIAHTIRPGQDTAALSAQVPGVQEVVELVLFADYGFDELLEKIDGSAYWEYAGKEGECMVEVREFGKSAQGRVELIAETPKGESVR